MNRSGGEFGCVQGTGIFDGPMDAASVAAIKSRHANVVRVPFNEDCWLGLPNVKPEYAGATYRAALKSYVDLLHQNGLVAILDLHRPATWSPRGTRTTSTRAARRRAGTAGSRRSPRRCRWWPGRSARTTARAATSPAWTDWLDRHQVSYLGWTWNTWNCGSGPSLISSCDGTPTAFGAGIRAHFLAAG